MQARRLFAVMATVFEEPNEELSNAYVERLLARPEFWAIAAFSGDDEVIGGLTAHTLAMTRSEAPEIFIYDVAVREDHQRRGVGRLLIRQLRMEAAAMGIRDLFVPADDEDVHALDFYRALGGVAASVTIFTWSGEDGSRG